MENVLPISDATGTDRLTVDDEPENRDLIACTTKTAQYYNQPKIYINMRTSISAGLL